MNSLYKQCFSKVQSNKEKGNRFENFTKELFNTVNGFIFIKSNLQTDTSEIDLLYKHNNPFSEKFGLKPNEFIIQSKNEKKTTDINAVTHLFSELMVRKLELGIIITVNHLSPEGYTRINQHYQGQDKTILVIEGDDIEEILKNGNYLDEILYHKYYELRFVKN